MRVLLVDDDADDRTLFFEAISSIDARVECDFATNGLEALNRLNTLKQKPDVIFLDINMPIMDGRACLAEIKSDHDLQSIPVVVCSTSADADEIRALKRLGAGYIVKPSCFEKLVDLIRNQLHSIGRQPVPVRVPAYTIALTQHAH